MDRCDEEFGIRGGDNIILNWTLKLNQAFRTSQT